MSAGLSRRTLLVAALAFAAALGIGYVASSPGSAEPAAKPVGTTAVPLDVPAASAEREALGEVEALPALARPPAPPPPPPEPPDEEPGPPDGPPEGFPDGPPPVEPVTPAPAPEPTPEPAPPPQPPPAPVEFDDSG